MEVCCGSRSKFALPSYVDWLPYPANAKELLERDSVLNLTDIIETEFEKHGVHAFGEVAGFNDLPLKLIYEPDSSLVGDLRIRYPKKAKARVGIQLKASSPIRTYPRINEVIFMLVEKGIEVVLSAEPHSVIIERPHPLLTNASADALDMEDSVARACVS